MKLQQRLAVAAALGLLLAPAAFAGQTPAPAAPAASDAPRKLISPQRGEATVEYTKPNTKVVGANAEAQVVDSDSDPGGERRLLRIGFGGSEDEDIVCLEVRCPSTARKYLLRVPPQTTGCAQAAAWVAGFNSARQYRPLVET